MGQDQSHGAAHLLSRPPSALTRHRHGRHAELILQIEEGYQVPVEREEAHAGRSRSRYRRGTSRLTRSASAIKIRFRGERLRRGGQDQHRRTTNPFGGSVSAKTYSNGRRQRRPTKRKRQRGRKGSQPGTPGLGLRHKGCGEEWARSGCSFFSVLSIALSQSGTRQCVLALFLVYFT